MGISNRSVADLHWNNGRLQKAREKLGPFVVSKVPNSNIRWIFPVPVGFRQLKDTTLVVEHPNYELEVEEGKDTIIVNPNNNKIIPFENFPKEDGWYKFDKATGIPINIKSEQGRLLHRYCENVGPLIRDVDVINERSGMPTTERYIVNAGCYLSQRLRCRELGVLVEEKE